VNKTSIEWVKNPDGTQGYTWNPITGCLNGCEYCYARKLAYGRLKSRYLANNNLAPTVGEGATPLHTSQLLDALDPFYPRFWGKRLNDPLKHKKPAGIFPVDMGEWQASWVPIEWSHAIIGIAFACPQHRFYLLTHQPQLLNRFSPFPDNCWVGVTATDTGMAYKAVNNLKRIEARVKYISFEPLLGKIINWVGDAEYLFKDLDWVIIGSQTKPYKPPELKWVWEIVQAADKAGVAVFLKDNLDSIIPYTTLFRTQDRKLRQELPDGKK